MRRLEMTIAGYWYVGLTVLLGVVAIVSGNNVLYLIESLLLSGMIFSGILSERFVSSVQVEVVRLPSSAGSASGDQVIVKNRRKFAIFCVEIGEWRGRNFVPVAYLPKLAPDARAVLHSTHVFESRGLYRWDGIAVATAYPFGLARKIRWIKEPGSRVIWPSRGDQAGETAGESGKRQRPRRGSEFSEGEVRPLTPADDGRGIVWTLSAKGGDPYVRVRRSDAEDPTVVLDLRDDPGKEFEERVIAAAEPFYRQAGESASGMLILVDRSGRRRVQGRSQILNQLAFAQPIGRNGS